MFAVTAAFIITNNSSNLEVNNCSVIIVYTSLSVPMNTFANSIPRMGTVDEERFEMEEETVNPSNR